MCSQKQSFEFQNSWLLGIERPVIFGHSAGGFVALHMAVRHPEFVGGLILCDSTPIYMLMAMAVLHARNHAFGHGR
jgi:pimeloyl-ACP methyl ester carboxylesterase